jgi:hypothetical protein
MLINLKNTLSRRGYSGTLRGLCRDSTPSKLPVKSQKNPHVKTCHRSNVTMDKMDSMDDMDVTHNP